MRLNNLQPALGSNKAPKRLGRGPGSGTGKTAGKGHKGWTARAGNQNRNHFEGGQTPLQRRLPKVGFTSRVGLSTGEVALSELRKVEGDVVNIDTLRAADLIPFYIKRVKIFASGSVEKAFKVSGVRVTKGAKEAIEKAGGSIEG